MDVSPLNVLYIDWKWSENEMIMNLSNYFIFHIVLEVSI